MHPAVRLLAGVLTGLSTVSCAGSGAEASHGPPYAGSDFARLRWLEGTWRGMGAGQPAFFEGYRFISDTSVRILYYADSTLSIVADSGSVLLANGQIEHRAGGGLWAATWVSPDSAVFAPKAAVTNSFSWVRAAADSWTAILRTPGHPDVVYQLVSWRP